jgi:Mrp family chromosome partitioning ATPase
MSSGDSSNVVNVLLTQIDAELERPSVLVITAAKKRDGSYALAHLLSQKLALQGNRTLFVQTVDETQHCLVPVRNMHEAELIRRMDDALVRGSSGFPDILPISNSDAIVSWSRSKIEALKGILLERYDLIVVDAPTPTTDAHAYLWVSAANKTIITLCEGRVVSGDDHKLRKLLDGSTNVMGVVALDSNFIKDVQPITLARLEELRPVSAVYGEYVGGEKVLERI